MKTSRKKPVNPDTLPAKMASLCSNSEQCKDDIRKKLLRAGATKEMCEDIITRLERNGFISEERYARAFTNDKVRFSAWGRYKIRMALYNKRIPAIYINRALEEIDEEEYREAARRAAESKARGLDLSQRNDLVKLYRHLASRGFESEIASRESKRMAKMQRRREEDESA